LAFTPLTYDYLLNSINIHILLNRKMARDFEEAKNNVYNAIKEGRLFVSPYLSNTLWGFQSTEAAIRAFYPARRLELAWGLPPMTVAEHIEEPSLPWGTASILAGCGIRWLSVPFYNYDSTFGQLRNPPLYEWLLWGVQLLAGPGPLSYLLLRYALIAAAGILFYFAALRATADAPRRGRLLLLPRALLLVRLGVPPQRLPFARHHRGGARVLVGCARLCRSAEPRPRLRAWAHHRCRHHGQMELSPRGGEPRRRVCA
jgi:hypothetical protein